MSASAQSDMYATWYERISAPWRKRAWTPRVLNALDKGLVAIVAAGYIGVLVWLFAQMVIGGGGSGTADTASVTTAASATTSATAYAATPTTAVRFWKALLVPALSFVLVSVVRARINAPRPYERFAIDPLIKKGTHGKSFPSRHLFSAAIIACTLWWLEPAWGAAAFAACIVVAFCRIVGGVHFPRDIVGAFAFALACAFVGFILIP